MRKTNPKHELYEQTRDRKMRDKETLKRLGNHKDKALDGMRGLKGETKTIKLSELAKRMGISFTKL